MEILDASNRVEYSRWCECWQVCDDREVFAHPDYLLLYTDEKTVAKCALLQERDQVMLYPFLLRSITKESYCGKEMGDLYDMITPYGYGGMITDGGGIDRELLVDFNNQFTKWAIDNHVVSEFVRFALKSKHVDDYAGEVVYNNDNVVVDLSMEEATIWRDFKPKVRKNVNHAKRCNLIVETDSRGDRLDDFLDIYYSTMERREATNTYYFPREYFESINHNLQGQYMYFHAKLDDVIVSTELVLISAFNIYSFLGGTKSEYFDLRPNDLLKFEIINWGRTHGKKQFILGGGYAPHDGIFNYKHAFAPDGIVPFHVGRRVFDQEMYDRLVERRKSLNPDFDENTSYFPVYRG